MGHDTHAACIFMMHRSQRSPILLHRYTHLRNASCSQSSTNTAFRCLSQFHLEAQVPLHNPRKLSTVLGSKSPKSLNSIRLARLALWLLALTSKLTCKIMQTMQTMVRHGAACTRDQATKDFHLFISARAVASHILGDCGHVLASNPAGSKVRLERKLQAAGVQPQATFILSP